MKNNKGFTLIELLVVIAIIGILATLSVVALGGAREKARDARRMSDLKQISTAMELYMSNNDTYPVGGSVACGAGVFANGRDLCTGQPISDTETTYLSAIPGDPVTGGGAYYYGFGSSGTSYCISDALEGGDYFVCQNGSCGEKTAGCPAS